MGGAGAVGTPETGNGDGAVLLIRKGLGPVVFHVFSAVGKADTDYGPYLFKVVDVPVGPGRWLKVMGKTGFEASGALGAAAVKIMASFEIKGAEFSDGQSLG